MIRTLEGLVWLCRGETLISDGRAVESGATGGSTAGPMNLSVEDGRKGTIAWSILQKHNTSDGDSLKLKFDSLISHDLTYVGIVQTARAGGLERFPLPYVLTNCHNSLCAVGGTINRDDHVFGMSACEKYGGIFVPANQSIIHSYAREMLGGCGRMVLGSDSHTRYGALGTLGVGEGGGELVKQLLEKTYDIKMPKVVGVYLKGKLSHGVGPQDVALVLVKELFKSGFARNKILEFVGPGVKNLSMDFRNGIDVMTTETACLSSVWLTDDKVKEYFDIHGRPEAYEKLAPSDFACYDGAVIVDLEKIEPMIALPFHPSNVYSIRELNDGAEDILARVEQEAAQQIENKALKLDLRSKIGNGRLRVDQAEIAGCSGGTFENLLHVSRIMRGKSIPKNYFSMSVYPASVPVLAELIKIGAVTDLIEAGVLLKSAFCGPCFGAGDVPANGSLAARHTTRNFANREGSKPKELQMASVALMDARSIAATAINEGYLTSAAEIDFDESEQKYHFDGGAYERTVYNGFGRAKAETKLRFGPNITDWPEMIPLGKHVLLKVASVILDPVTTTDELIPSGDAASYRSNPKRMADFTLSRRDPLYVGSAKSMQAMEGKRREGIVDAELLPFVDKMVKIACSASTDRFVEETVFGSVVCSIKPGDGSAREQAASCQKVLGGLANICVEYGTQRYRSNLVNWGMIPFTVDEEMLRRFRREEYLFIPDIREKILAGEEEVTGFLVGGDTLSPVVLKVNVLSREEADIICSGSLINYYSKC